MMGSAWRIDRVLYDAGARYKRRSERWFHRFVFQGSSSRNQLRRFTSQDDRFWQCPSAKEDKALTVTGDNSPLLGYMGNMFAIGVTVTPLAIGPDILPKKRVSLIAPSRAKLFADLGANVQGVWVSATYRNLLSTVPVVPSPLHRASRPSVHPTA